MFFNQHPHFCNVLQKRFPSVLCNKSGHQTTYFIVELPRNRGRSMSIATASFITEPFSPLKGKLKDIIIHFLYEIINDII